MLFVLIISVLIRFFLFALEKPFWLDEAGIALNVIDKNYYELFLPLNYAQSAPPIWLSAAKFFGSLFDYGEKALRFIPFISSIASVFAFYYLLKALFKEKNRFNKAVIAIGLVVYSVSYPILYNTIEFKPYSTDVLCTIIIFLAYFKFLNRQIPLSPQKQAILGIFFSLAPLLSFGSIFALITVCIMMLILSKGKNFITPLIFALALVLEYFLLFKNNHSGRIYEYWTPWFVNSSLSKALSAFSGLFKYYFYPSKFILFNIILFILGSIRLYKREREIFYPFFIIISGAFLASFLNVYPLCDRLSLFLYPVFLIIILFGILSSQSSENLFKKAVIWALSAFFIFGSVFYNFLNPKNFIREDIKPLLIRLRQEIRPGDKIAVFKHSHLAYRYYKRLFRFQNETLVCSPKQEKDCMADIEAFCGKKENCYIIYTTEIDFQKNIQKINTFLEENGGEIILKSGHTAYLYKIPRP